MKNDVGTPLENLVVQVKKIRMSLRIPTSVLLIFIVAVVLFAFGISQSLLRLTRLPQQIQETEAISQMTEVYKQSQPAETKAPQNSKTQQPSTATIIASIPTVIKAPTDSALAKVTPTSSKEEQLTAEIVRLLDELQKDLEKSAIVEEAEVP